MSKRTRTTAAQKLTALRHHRPRTREELRQWILLHLGLNMPQKGLCPGHQTPLDYLAHSFLEEPGDALVWACRGGGKTMIGAVATLLDLLFKPGIQVRILGGSFEQSEKMYAYLRALTQRHFLSQLKGPATQRRLEFTNGSKVEVLAQSDCSVRGQRVQKLRCDEVELFDPSVWQAAQLTTRSLLLPDSRPVRGAVEAFSTMHRPGGLMQQLLGLPDASPTPGKKIFTWCLWDVLEHCPPARSCDTCLLYDGCRGRAKNSTGFLKIDDAIAMKSRVSHATWEHEMLCALPRREDAVFPTFRRATHVRPLNPDTVREGTRLLIDNRPLRIDSVFAGVDFGFANAFVCLWIASLREEASPTAPRTLWVFDELVTQHQTLSRNIASIAARSPKPAILYCDIAGRHTNPHTGQTDEALLRDAGFLVKSNFMNIDTGLAALLDKIEPAAGPPRLFIDPRCPRLIAALENYHRRPDGKPDKDGTHDHPIDALRYAAIGHETPSTKIKIRYY